MQSQLRHVSDVPEPAAEPFRIPVVPGAILQTVLVLTGLGCLAGAIMAGRAHEVVYSGVGSIPSIRTYEPLVYVLGAMTALCLVLAVWIQVRRLRA